MRAAILIIGSLYWNPLKVRDDWRKERLRMEAKQFVCVPIRYRRLSDNKTYTMAFAARGFGDAMAIPCKSDVTSIDSLVAEARALWRAEDRKDPGQGAISKEWGAVAVLFRRGLKNDPLAKKWTEFFKKNRVPPEGPDRISTDGLLQISWPKTKEGDEVDFDVLLATANSAVAPHVDAVAQAWLEKENGEEHYFFNNVTDGIRTPLDGRIWGHLAGKKKWSAKYPEAVRILRAEARRG